MKAKESSENLILSEPDTFVIEDSYHLESQAEIGSGEKRVAEASVSENNVSGESVTHSSIKDPVQQEGTPSEQFSVEPTRRSSRTRKSPQYYSSPEHWANLAKEGDLSINCSEDEPNNYTEALSSREVKQWEATMREEIESLHKNKTWALVSMPEDRKAIKCRWVYKLKFSKNKVSLFKARLVAKGYSQVKGVDYEETYSPVVRHGSVRAILSISATRDYEIVQLDVKTAFLYGELKETIYMDQPEGFVESGSKDKVCLLNKSLYGLKQASCV